MPLVYITGIAGAGKSTVRDELLRRGYTAFGGLEDGIAAFYDNATGERVAWVPAETRTAEWLARHTWRMPRATIEKLHADAKDKLVFLCAYAPNDKTELWDLFDTVVALTIDEATLRERLASRTNNDVGKMPLELEKILARRKTATHEYQKFGAVVIDATQPLGKVVDDVLATAGVTYEQIGWSKNGVAVVYDPRYSHAATHFEDTPPLKDLVAEIISAMDLHGQRVATVIDMGRVVGTTDVVAVDASDTIVYAKRKNRDTDGLVPFTKTRGAEPLRGNSACAAHRRRL